MDFLSNRSAKASSIATNRSMFAPKAGKAATKGQKQIYEDNLATIKFYQLVSVAIIAIYIIITSLFIRDRSPWANTASTTFLILAMTIHTISIGAMRFMAKPAFAPNSKTIVDGGIDLNMNAGFAENLKDLMILTWILQILSLISNNFWYLILLVPAKGIYMLWSNVLGPWFFAPAPEEPPQEVAEKKQRKMERKMKQSSQVRYR